MAESVITKTTLRINLQKGIDSETGKTILKAKSFNNVKANASADQLYEVASALVSLQQLPVFNYERADNSEITP